MSIRQSVFDNQLSAKQPVSIVLQLQSGADAAPTNPSFINMHKLSMFGNSWASQRAMPGKRLRHAPLVYLSLTVYDISGSLGQTGEANNRHSVTNLGAWY